ncbi:nuclear transport factor 2 family protein [Streptosporangium sp. KLBMP 9127]|nr:nuclear transport factor 2 family protein [Streptosporangium sp. KLBMP 9127]
MYDFANLVERYLAAWNEGDAEARLKAVAALWTEDGGYTDPMAQVTGHEGIAAVIAGVREMFPGFVFTAGGPVDGHHDIARFTWNFGPAGAEPVVVGSDVVQIAEDGRLRQVHGFLDKVPAA